MATELLLLYLDREHLGDTMFIKELASRLTRLGMEGPPRAVIHGSGPQTEQALETEGLFLERSKGVFPVSSPREQALVERSIRETNQRMVSLLTELHVASVGIQGVDRKLFQRSKEQLIQVHNPQWIEQLAQQYVTPVISTLGVDTSSGQIHELSAPLAVNAFARASSFDTVTVVCFTTGKGLGIQRNGEWQSQMPVEELTSEDPIVDLEAVKQLAAQDVPVLLTSGRGLSAEHGLRGTRVVLSSNK